MPNKTKRDKLRKNVWQCRIGPAPWDVPSGGDNPMRRAVANAFYDMFGEDAAGNFSGWGERFTESELAVIGDRTPVYAKTEYAKENTQRGRIITLERRLEIARKALWYELRNLGPRTDVHEGITKAFAEMASEGARGEDTDRLTGVDDQSSPTVPPDAHPPTGDGGDTAQPRRGRESNAGSDVPGGTDFDVEAARVAIDRCAECGTVSRCDCWRIGYLLEPEKMDATAEIERLKTNPRPTLIDDPRQKEALNTARAEIERLNLRRCIYLARKQAESAEKKLRAAEFLREEYGDRVTEAKASEVLRLEAVEEKETAERERDEARELMRERYSLPRFPGVIFPCKDDARAVQNLWDNYDVVERERDALKKEVKGLYDVLSCLPKDRLYCLSQTRSCACDQMAAAGSCPACKLRRHLGLSWGDIGKQEEARAALNRRSDV